MIKHILFGAALLALAACGDDEQTSDTPDAEAGPPDKPALGDQMDRMGRPAINTALNHAFDTDEVTKQAAKDAWNENDDPSSWGDTFGADLRGGLGILDGLEGGASPTFGCGNQLAADLAAPRYSGLAGVLADDRVYVNSAPTGGCNAYLAVEANALAVVPNDDCGGRVMSYDVIETSYSVLTIGALTGVDDGIAAEAVETDPDAFPFLADPV